MAKAEVTVADQRPSHRRANAPTLARDQIFEVLSNQRRRYVLHYLKRNDDRERIPLRELVDQVAAWENDTPVEKLDSSDRKCVYTALKQSHLPKLDDMGVVEYDNLRGEVTLTEAAEEVQLYLEYVPEDDPPWSQYYLVLSGACGTLALGAWAGIDPFGQVSGLLIAGLVVTAFVASSALHAYARRRRADTGIDPADE